MSDQEKELLENESLEIAELDDDQLEDVAGGDNTSCPNLACDDSCGGFAMK